MQRRVCLIFLLSVAHFVHGKDYQAKFLEYFHAGDSENQFLVLRDWEKSAPQDPELFISYFNYHFQQSIREVQYINPYPQKSIQGVLKFAPGAPPREEDTMQLIDSSGEAVGYVESRAYVEITELQKGIDKINEGIKLYPNRLDMRLGKIYAWGQAQEWERFTDEIIQTIRYSSTNKNAWAWKNGHRLKEGKEQLLDSIQAYQKQLFDTYNDDLLVNREKIAREVLALYPDHVESLSSLGGNYLLTGEIEKGLQFLFKAEKLAPQDPIVLYNIARGFVLKDEKAKAIAYYEKAIQYGDEHIQSYAQKRIEELK